MWALWDFDGKGPCMGKILHIFRNLEKHVVSLRGEPFRLDHDMADPMEDTFYNRWTMVKTDLHYAGALLNPYLLQELADDSNSLIACKRVLQKLCSPETYPDVVQDFLAFRHSQTGLAFDVASFLLDEPWPIAPCGFFFKNPKIPLVAADSRMYMSGISFAVFPIHSGYCVVVGYVL
jgi:hypothetical protein